MTAAGFPHWDTLGSTLGCQLPEAYRRLPRPSSALGAKASTLRSYITSHNNFGSYNTPPRSPPPQQSEDHHGQQPPGRVAKTKDARVHCAVLKQQPAPAHPPRLLARRSGAAPAETRARHHPHPRSDPDPHQVRATPTPGVRARPPTSTTHRSERHRPTARKKDPGAGSAWLLPQDPTACDGRRSTRELPPGARTAPAWAATPEPDPTPTHHDRAPSRSRGDGRADPRRKRAG